jgi:hypothetical protein
MATSFRRSRRNRLRHANARNVLRAPGIQQEWAHGEHEFECGQKRAGHSAIAGADGSAPGGDQVRWCRP